MTAARSQHGRHVVGALHPLRQRVAVDPQVADAADALLGETGGGTAAGWKRLGDLRYTRVYWGIKVPSVVKNGCGFGRERSKEARKHWCFSVFSSSPGPTPAGSIGAEWSRKAPIGIREGGPPNRLAIAVSVRPGVRAR